MAHQTWGATSYPTGPKATRIFFIADRPSCPEERAGRAVSRLPRGDARGEAVFLFVELSRTRENTRRQDVLTRKTSANAISATRAQLRQRLLVPRVRAAARPEAASVHPRH